VTTAHPALYSPSAGVSRVAAADAGAHVPAPVKAKLKEKADEFEAYFMQQFIDIASPDQSDDPFLGGGQTESFYTQKMHEEMAKGMVARGGIGLSKNVYAQLLKMESAKYAPASAQSYIQPQGGH
jgi:Rod binding domain-containing protein